MAFGSFVQGSAQVSIDMSDMQAKLLWLRSVLTNQQFDSLMRRTFNEVGKRSKPLISEPVSQDYFVTKKWMSDQIGSARIGTGFLGVSCIIPIAGRKGKYGPSGTFKLTRAVGRIRGNVVRDHETELPEEIKHLGGNKPFVATMRHDHHTLVFVRKTKKRFPIASVTAVAAPQMPANLSEDEVKDGIFDLTAKRLQQNFDYMFTTKFR